MSEFMIIASKNIGLRECELEEIKKELEKYIKSGESGITELWENSIIWDKRINLKPNDLIKKSNPYRILLLK